MVEEVKAWRDSAGTIHLSELDAARAEAKLRLEKIFGSRAVGSAHAPNSPCVAAVLEQPQAILEALEPLVELIRMDEMFSKPKEVGKTGQTLDERYPGGVPDISSIG